MGPTILDPISLFSGILHFQGWGERPTLLDWISLFQIILHFLGKLGARTYCFLSSEKFNHGDKSSSKDQGWGGGTYSISPDFSISRNSAFPRGGGMGPTVLDPISLFSGILHLQG